VADVVDRLGADILNMVEIEGCGILHRLVTDVLPDAGYTPFLTRGTDSCPGPLGAFKRPFKMFP
jgi:hypothetical protein